MPMGGGGRQTGQRRASRTGRGKCCPRCRGTDHEPYSCLLSAPESGDGTILRVVWADQFGSHWKAYVCRRHLPGFIHTRILDDDVAVLRRGQETSWDRACDVCLDTAAKHRFTWRDSSELLHGLRAGGRTSRRPSSLGDLLVTGAVVLGAWFGLSKLLAHTSSWQALVLGVALACVGPTVMRKARTAAAGLAPRVAEAGHAVGSSIRSSGRRPARARGRVGSPGGPDPSMGFGFGDLRLRAGNSSARHAGPAQSRIQTSEPPELRSRKRKALPTRKVVPREPKRVTEEPAGRAPIPEPPDGTQPPNWARNWGTMSTPRN